PFRHRSPTHQQTQHLPGGRRSDRGGARRNQSELHEMKNLAAIMPTLGTIQIQEVPFSDPSPEQARVRIEAVGVCGSDTAYYRVGYIGDRKVSGPIILGHEASGTVVAVGEGVVNV